MQKFNWDIHGDVYSEWFKLRDAVRPMDEIVSPTGLVATYDNKPVCIGFLCKTDSRVALITNLISDPNADKDIRKKCLEQLVEELSSVAESEGFLILGAASPVPSVCDMYERLGFIKTHEKINNYGRIYALDTSGDYDCQRSIERASS